MSQYRVISVQQSPWIHVESVTFNPPLKDPNSCVGVCLAYFLGGCKQELINDIQDSHAKDKPYTTQGQGTDILSAETQDRLGIHISSCSGKLRVNIGSRFLMLVEYKSEGKIHHHMILNVFLLGESGVHVQRVCPISHLSLIHI